MLDRPTLPVQHSYTVNTVFRHVFYPRNFSLAIPHIGLSYSSCLLFDLIVLRIIFGPQETKFKFPAEIYKINFFIVWFIFIMMLCLVVSCDVNQCRNGGGNLIRGTEVLSLTSVHAVYRF